MLNIWGRQKKGDKYSLIVNSGINLSMYFHSQLKRQIMLVPFISKRFCESSLKVLRHLHTLVINMINIIQKPMRKLITLTWKLHLNNKNYMRQKLNFKDKKKIQSKNFLLCFAHQMKQACRSLNRMLRIQKFQGNGVQLQFRNAEICGGWIKTQK